MKDPITIIQRFRFAVSQMDYAALRAKKPPVPGEPPRPPIPLHELHATAGPVLSLARDAKVDVSAVFRYLEDPFFGDSAAVRAALSNLALHATAEGPMVDAAEIARRRGCSDGNAVKIIRELDGARMVDGKWMAPELAFWKWTAGTKPRGKGSGINARYAAERAKKVAGGGYRNG